VKYAVEMDSGAMTYTASFIKTDSYISREIYRQIAWRSHKPVTVFQNKKNMPEKVKFSLCSIKHLRACVRVCVRACVRACARVKIRVFLTSEPT
jgi:hypothetical protein